MTLFLHLPHELFIQILVRLPVKSLLCLKCVCKSCFSLISDPQFAKLHFQLTIHTPTIMCMSGFPPMFHSIDIEQFLNNDPASFNFNFPFPKSEFPEFPYIIEGSCRGFLFISGRLNFYLWNPFTGFKKQIPLSPVASKVERYCSFGYDQSRDDYLVVVMSRDSTLLSPVMSSHLEVFSFRDNMWKEIDNTPFPYDGAVLGFQRKWSLFNGAIHWLVFCYVLKKNAIVVFDLMERKLSYIDLPDNFNNEVDGRGLWVFKEFLSLWDTDYVNRRVEIWVMKEYKVHSSWTKTLVLPLYPLINNLIYPMYCTKNGDIIGINDASILVKYNDKGEVLGHHSFSERLPIGGVLHTESLISLPGDNEQV